MSNQLPQPPQRDSVRRFGSPLVGDRSPETGGLDGINADDLATARVIRGTELFARLGVQWLHERQDRG